MSVKWVQQHQQHTLPVIWRGGGCFCASSFCACKSRVIAAIFALNAHAYINRPHKEIFNKICYNDISHESTAPLTINISYAALTSLQQSFIFIYADMHFVAGNFRFDINSTCTYVHCAPRMNGYFHTEPPAFYM